MLKTLIYGVASLVCFVASAFAMRNAKRRTVVVFWWFCFVVALSLQIKSIYESYQSGKETTALREQVRLAQDGDETA